MKSKNSFDSKLESEHYIDLQIFIHRNELVVKSNLKEIEEQLFAIGDDIINYTNEDKAFYAEAMINIITKAVKMIQSGLTPIQPKPVLPKIKKPKKDRFAEIQARLDRLELENMQLRAENAQLKAEIVQLKVRLSKYEQV